MEGQQKRQWGITSAISEAQPTEADNKLNDELVEALKRQNVFESTEGSNNRLTVLNHLQKVVEEFVRRVSKKKGLAQATVDASGGKIFCFGSYALGVYGPTSDIDTLLVAPKHVFLDDFFDHFPSTFKEMSRAEDITEFNPVRDAFVPIIKMEYRGVSIDLIFASLPTMTHISKDLETIDKTMLRNLDDTAMRSVNGTRVTKELLQSVPQVKSFRHALRAIKLWSNQRAIYGAVFGYPGGIAWAIMVARICQLYPFACGATILSKFFSLMYKYQWPKPILLKHIEEGTLGLRVWNPTIYSGDRQHLMPIITPAFPSMCATHTIGLSTRAIMMQEFERADKIVYEIHSGKKSWDALFERHSFFTKDHKYYLSVVAASRSKEANSTFSGLVQSKVRLLVKGIDEGQAGVEVARPYTKSFERIHRCANEDQVDRVIQGNLDYMVKDASTPLEDNSTDHIIYTSTFYIGLTLPPEGAKSLDISYPVSDFKRTVMTSDMYNEDTMSVKVVHTRNTQLPDDVFVPGETRPKKPTKEKKKKDTSKGVKRPLAETGLDVRESRLAKTPRRSPASQE
ncbi:Poly(A) polymerase [Dothidotthia symphoricarpi CBS 119687]|uniref:Poly(A) polymerase n=1 Tax=Dothidotthia symphoricarpi CBS 119687 TaxID=1392245 RepID=A0A6A5ZZP5_9PLEO|nr:Poly(A) polymerase [Dothidotthia symphoricarpi CBS 119687]KAF2124756.1 Poly(A) polymerase [Dothidotthia symphoricarpi CBS 119687]